jgi:hypothetical protein
VRFAAIITRRSPTDSWSEIACVVRGITLASICVRARPHYDVQINYVGHAEQWDEISIDGDIPSKDCLLRFKRNGRVLAVASIFRDLDNLRAELEMEQAMRK